MIFNDYTDYPVTDVTEDGEIIHYTIKVSHTIADLKYSQICEILQEEDERKDKFFEACYDDNLKLLKETLTRENKTENFNLNHIKSGFQICCKQQQFKCARYIASYFKIPNYSFRRLSYSAKDETMKKWLETLSNKEE